MADAVDEAYEAINEFEVRRQMEESRKEIMMSGMQPGGFVHPSQSRVR